MNTGEPLFDSDPDPDSREASNAAVPAPIQSLVNEQAYAVLCVQGGGQPYGALVAFAFSKDPMNFYNSVGGGQMRRAGVTAGTAGNLAVGTSIGSTGSFNTSTGNVYGTTSTTGLLGGWTYSSENIIGFKFVAAAGTTHYGWMRFAMGAATGSTTVGPTRTLVDYGWESTAGVAILAGAGAVPAPGALALLGLAGLATRRRRA